jgi:hypothetical protein
MCRRFFTSLVLGCGLLAAVGASGADEDDKPQFPQPGSEIPGPFHVLNITGARKNRYHCLVCRNMLQPVAAIFVQPHLPPAKDDQKEPPAVLWAKEKLDKDQPLLHLIKKLDAIIDRNPDAHMGAFFLFQAKGDDQVPIRTRLLELPQELGMRKPPKKVDPDEADKPKPIDDGHVVFCVDNELPAAWKINPEDEVTVVLYRRHKVVQHYRFKEMPTDKDVNEIVAQYDKMVPEFARPDKKPQLRLPD